MRVKLTAVGLAVVTWYVIREDISTETCMDRVPVSILADEGWTILERNPQTIDIQFKGSKSAIQSLKTDDIKVILDTREIGSHGTHILEIGADAIQVPGGIRPVLIKPDNIKITLDREIEKHVPVKVGIKGIPPPGYEVERVHCEPLLVRLKGAKRLLEELEEIRTRPVELEGRIQSFKIQRTELIAPASDVFIDPGEVTVDVVMIERSTAKLLKQVPVHILTGLEMTSSMEVQPRSVNLSVKGHVALIEKFEQEQVRAFIDATSLSSPGRYELPVQVHLPDRVLVEKVEPATVRVAVGERGAISDASACRSHL